MKKLVLLIMVITLGVVAVAQKSYYIKNIVTNESTWKDAGGIAEVNGAFVTLKYDGHKVDVHTFANTIEEFVDENGNNVAMWNCSVTDNGKQLAPMVFGMIYKGEHLAFMLIPKDKKDPFYILFDLIPQLKDGGYGL